ncbi:MAG: TonB family protein [Sulfurimonas sp.]|nr:TonB family protein [Sulfurimonas sp.]MDD5202284.1 TonB family protein [Sulfurimonas sp.]
MKRHTHSILISIFIHSIVFIALLYSFSSVLKVQTQEEQKFCLHLCAVQPRVAVNEVKKIQEEKVEPSKTIEIPKEIPKVKTQLTPAIKKVEVKDAPVQKEETAPNPPAQSTQTDEANTQTQPLVTRENPSEKEPAPVIIKEEDAYLQEHLALIKQLLEENLYYPRSARKRGITGEVIVKFKLMRDARVEYIKVVKSPNDILSRGTIETIENIASKFPKPENDLILTVPIFYDLNK